MIRVAFLTPSLHTGGAERFILTLARHFQHCVPTAVIQVPMAGNVLRHFSDPEIERRMGQVMRIERINVFGEDQTAMVTNACRDADVLITWGIPNLHFFTQDLRIPVVEVSHASGEWSEQAKITHSSPAGASHLVAVSETARDAFPAEIRGRVEVIYNGIDAEHVMPRLGRDRQRAAWQINGNVNVALFLGRFAEVKRPELFVEAIAKLPEEWIGVMIGHGPVEGAIRELAGRTCHGRILFPGVVSHAGDAFAASDVFVMTSEAEGHPLTLTEAWIAGVPCVSTGLPFLEEAKVILDCMPCTSCDSDPDCIAAAIATAMSDEWTDDRRNVACQHFSASAMACRWEQYLLNVVQERDARQILGV